MKTNKNNSYTINFRQILSMCVIVFICVLAPNKSFATAVYTHIENISSAHDTPIQSESHHTANNENNLILTAEVEDIIDLYYSKVAIQIKSTKPDNFIFCRYNYTESGTLQHHVDVPSPPPNTRLNTLHEKIHNSTNFH